MVWKNEEATEDAALPAFFFTSNGACTVDGGTVEGKNCKAPIRVDLLEVNNWQLEFQLVTSGLTIV